ncbi:SGNH/GDSL hydrolase family protein [Mycetocola zhadangensis]|uniref:SGNH/GDSL hydrolase family protein n=1 Tax=Mycetocola zhadangensis TaxID=1164595 RepID=UPI003A4E25C9
MAKRRNHQASAQSRFAAIGKYLLLIVLAVVAVALVVLALNRPSVTPAEAGRTPAVTNTPDSTPTPTPTAMPQTVAFLGDTYTAGDGVTAFDQRWTSRLSVANGWTEVNAGVATTGYATAGASDARPYTERVAEIVAAAPDIVIVSGGRFDYLGSSSAAAVSAGIVDTFTELRAGLPEAQIIAIGPIWGDSAPPARLAEIASEVRVAVEATGGSFLDVGQPLEGRPDVIADDGVSPTDEGHALLLEAIRTAIEPVVTARP